MYGAAAQEMAAILLAAPTPTRYAISVYVVYGIIDPRTDAVFYIGQSSDFAARKAAHIEGSDQISGYTVKQMKLNGFVPLFLIFESMATKAEALSAEIFWIELMKARGAKLLNAQGIGGYVARGRLRRTFAGALKAMQAAKAAGGTSRTTATLEDIANGRSVRTNETWDAREIARLKGMVRVKMSLAAIADALERAPTAILGKCSEIGLKPPGTTRRRRWKRK
jgi:predicted GIY-YIG superfamily endonuclease